jgi:hypothetical protein
VFNAAAASASACGELGGTERRKNFRGQDRDGRWGRDVVLSRRGRQCICCDISNTSVIIIIIISSSSSSSCASAEKHNVPPSCGWHECLGHVRLFVNLHSLSLSLNLANENATFRPQTRPNPHTSCSYNYADLGLDLPVRPPVSHPGANAG